MQIMTFDRFHSCRKLEEVRQGRLPNITYQHSQLPHEICN